MTGQQTSLPDDGRDRQAKRLFQVISVALAGMIVAAAVADGRVQVFLLAGCLLVAFSAWLAYQRHPSLAAGVFLWSLTLMLSVLAWKSEGVRDMSLLAYPGVLIFAAILGNKILFISLLIFMVGYPTLLGILTLTGVHTPYIYETAPRHIVFTDIVLLLTGFSAYLLLRDQRHLLDSLRDENERVRESQGTISRLANMDQLTGLANRRQAENAFHRLYRRCVEENCQLALLFLDLDNFKPVNDSLGHAAGDLLLQQLAERMQVLVGEDDVLCRFGGDEFLLLTTCRETDQERVRALAGALISAASTPFYIMQNQIDISGSVGIALAPQHGSDYGQLCRYADMAMYQAKADGRNVYRIYHEDMSRAGVDKFNLMKSLRCALNQQQFHLYYQPRISLDSGCINGAEALIRWPQAGGGYIPPDEFIPLAESSGLIAEIGDWVVREACQACARWRAQGYRNLQVAVNLSYVQFRDGRLANTVRQALNEAGLPGDALELELTESMLIGESDSIQQQLEEIRSLGVVFAIDDFGTGYSNLAYLRRFRASSLKIDRSFVSPLGQSRRDRPLVQAIIQMAGSLGLRAVAEGVEDQETLAQLKELGCAEAQGFFWSGALPEADFIHWLQDYVNHHGGCLPHSSEL